jgi:four helix bundle protein
VDVKGMSRKVERFENLEVWQMARELVKVIYTATDNAKFRKELWLQDQIRRGAVSVMANIAEGFGRHSRGEFARFLNMARGSLAELQSHLYVALRYRCLGRNDFSTTLRKV